MSGTHVTGIFLYVSVFSMFLKLALQISSPFFIEAFELKPRGRNFCMKISSALSKGLEVFREAKNYDRQDLGLCV